MPDICALVDITDSFAEWMTNHEYKDAYFEHPEDLELALVDFSDFAAERVRQELNHPGVDDNTVVAVLGLASLFGLIRVAELIAKSIPRYPAVCLRSSLDNGTAPIGDCSMPVTAGTTTLCRLKG